MIEVETCVEPHPETERCAEQVTAIKREITSAISAIQHNDVLALEQSLFRQQALCSAFRAFSQYATDDRPASHPGSLHFELEALRQLTTTYRALVELANASAKALSRLCHSYNEYSHLEE